MEKRMSTRRSPYGYGSPLIAAADAGAAAELIEAALETAAGHRIVSIFLRLHPLLPVPLSSLAEAGEVRFDGPTVTIDTGAGHDESWRQIRKGHRSEINQLRRHGFEVVVDDWTRLGDFVTLYHATMRRLGANEWYLFAGDYFDRLADQIEGRIHLFSVLDTNGEAAAGHCSRITSDG